MPSTYTAAQMIDFAKWCFWQGIEVIRKDQEENYLSQWAADTDWLNQQ